MVDQNHFRGARAPGTEGRDLTDRPIVKADLTYGQSQAARLTGCSVGQVRYWAEIGLVAPGGENNQYTFADLVSLRLVASLLEGGMSLNRVRNALDYVRNQTGDDRDPIPAGLKLVTDGKTIFQVCVSDGEVLDALKGGQLVMFVAVDEISRTVGEDVIEFERDRRNFIERLSSSEVATSE